MLKDSYINAALNIKQQSIFELQAAGLVVSAHGGQRKSLFEIFFELHLDKGKSAVVFFVQNKRVNGYFERVFDEVSANTRDFE